MATRQREKALKRAQNKDKRPHAMARYIRIPSSKIEIVLDLIRGKGYEQAVAILANTNKSACEPVLKVLNSAAANAEKNLNMPKDTLYVAECFATSGPTLKRMMPRARGRADRIFKRTSHIQIILQEKKEVETVKKATIKTTKSTTKENPTVKAETEIKEKTTTSVKAGKASANTSANAKTTGAKPTAKAKEVPVTQSERPLTTEPNAKKPLGTKKESK